MQNNILVTVLIRTFNRAELLDRAIQSVLGQAYKNFELIIIGDASKDNTPKVIDKYIKENKTIKYIRNKERKGHIPSLNLVTKIANGKGKLHILTISFLFL